MIIRSADWDRTSILPYDASYDAGRGYGSRSTDTPQLGWRDKMRAVKAFIFRAAAKDEDLDGPLTADQRDGLVAVAMRAVVYYAGGARYVCLPSWEDREDCPVLQKPTPTFVSLEARGLIQCSDREAGSDSCTVVLTNSGLTMLQEVLSPKERSVLVRKAAERESVSRQAAEQARYEEERARRDRQEVKRRQRSDEVAYYRRSIREATAGISSIDSILLQLALKIGRGSNEIDDIIHQIRRMTGDRDRLAGELRASQEREQELRQETEDA